MAWQDESVARMRAITGDLEVPYVYTDGRLQTLWLLALDQVQLDTLLDYDYEISVSSTGLTPDPTLTSPRDSTAVVLATLKSICMLRGSELRIATTSSFKVKDGISTIETVDYYKNLSELSKSTCGAYDDALDIQSRYYVESGRGTRAIVGPFSNELYWYNKVQGPNFF